MSDNKPEPPNCDVEGCSKDSKFLLTVGDRCPEHAKRDQPKTVNYLDWATQGEP